MANRTDTQAQTVHGQNPQFLISAIIRNKIYEEEYWKRYCFGLNAETFVDQAVKLEYIGGTYGGRRRPTRFLCLMLKLLQIRRWVSTLLSRYMQPDRRHETALQPGIACELYTHGLRLQGPF